MTIILITMKNNCSFYSEKNKSFWILITLCWKFHTIDSAMKDLMKTKENGNGVWTCKVSSSMTSFTWKRADYLTVLYVYTSLVPWRSLLIRFPREVRKSTSISRWSHGRVKDWPSRECLGTTLRLHESVQIFAYVTIAMTFFVIKGARN